MKTCALCGKQAKTLGGHVTDATGSYDLCHDKAMSCYHRWTVYHERPGSPPWTLEDHLDALERAVFGE